MKLSAHFSLEEATISGTAIKLGLDNTPGLIELERMKQTAARMEIVRVLLKGPITVSSFFRSPEVNRAVGSSDRSQHRFGEAVDFNCTSFGTPVEICKKLIAHKHIVKFDQLILEHSWVHISFAIRTGKPRGQVLSLLLKNKYAVGLTNVYGVPYK